MQLVKSKQEHIIELVRISKEAFDSDIHVGAAETDGPPAYDSISWHSDMMEEGHLFTALVEGNIVGGAIIFLDDAGTLMNIGRIFVNPQDFRKGYGKAIMAQLENDYPQVTIWELETPIWNIRTNHFYKKIGFKEVKKDNEFVRYQKIRCHTRRF